MAAADKLEAVTNGSLWGSSEEEKRTTKEKGRLSFSKMWNNHEHRRKVVRTLRLGAAFWALGFTVGQRGPAFLDLQIITQTDVEAASFFFTASSAGYLLGSLVGGVLYDKVNKSLLLVLCVLGMALTTAALPWCSPYALMIAIHLLVSTFGGGLDTSGNAEVIRIWGKEGEMAMQFIHFSFAFGGIVGPLSTEPFLTPTPDDTDIATTISLPGDDAVSVIPPLDNITTNSSSTPPLLLDTDIHYAFLISGGMVLLMVIPLTMQLFEERSQQRRQNQVDEKPEEKQPLPMALFVFVQGCVCMFYFWYCCVEDTFVAYLSTFVVQQLHWSKARGAQITSVYWASFASFRFLSIFAVRVLTPVKLLLLTSSALLASMTAFLLFSQYHILIGVWVSTAFAGASMSAIFPTGFSWMEKELVRVTGRVAASILVSSASASMVNPIITGYMMQDLTPMWFAYLLCGQTVLYIAVFLFLLAFSRLYLSHHYHMQREQEQTMQVPNLSVDGSGTGLDWNANAATLI